MMDDGFPDVFVANDNSPNLLFHNSMESDLKRSACRQA